MFLPRFSIERPVAATMMVGALIVFGLISWSRLGVSLFPDVDFPVVTVTTTWQNARPEEVDNEITDQLEDAIGTISGIKHILSQSLQGVSRITVEFELDKDVDIAAQEVRDKVSARLGRLPNDADVPVVDKLDINAQPIMWLALTGPQAIETLTLVADEQIRPLLQKIEGVGEVRVGGSREKEVQVRLNRERLAAYNIGVDEVIEAIRRQHVDIPGGKLESPKKEFVVRTVGEFETASAFNDLIVDYRQGTPIRLGQLGTVEAGREENRPVARFTTKATAEKSVGLGVAPRSGANEVAIATMVKKLLPEICAMLPEGMRIEMASDRTVFIEQSIREIQTQLLVGALMTALVIFVFLQNARTTLISAVAIPTSLIATFAFMYMLDFTFNNMTMLGLAMAVGLVIDDAIVMVENIFRHRSKLAKEPMEAAYDGSDQIAFAVVATTVVLLGVFLPVAFMRGIVGRFFFQFAVTVAGAVACSTFVALTVVPMLSSRFLKMNTASAWGPFKLFNIVMDRGTRFYVQALSFFLRHRLAVVLIAVGFLGIGVLFFARLGKEFVTAEDQSRFLLRMETPLSYSIEKTEEVLRRIEAQIQEIPEIKHFFSIAGAGGGGIVESNKAIAFVTLVPKGERTRSQQEVRLQVQRVLQEAPDVRGSASDIIPLGGGARGEEIQLVIQGPSIEGLDRISRTIMNRLEQTPGFIGITRDLEIGKPEVRVRIDREKAADAGIRVQEVALAVGAMIGGVDVAEFKEGGRSYDIRLRLEVDQRVLPQDIERIWVRSGNGNLVDIKNFVTVEVGVGPNTINRLDRQRSATVYANLEGLILGEAVPVVERIAAEAVTGPYSTRLMGTAEVLEETGTYIAFAFLLAIVFTYMVLAAQFESFVFPFSIMMGLPLSFIGAFGLLLLLGNTFNLFSMIGLVLLVGLATKNGILLVDLTNRLRAQGRDVNEALVEAGSIRLRPILMTAISTVAAVLPVALGIGVGSESRQPMAVAIAGGILSSTFLTVAILPVIYSYLAQFSRWRLFERLRERAFADR